MIKEESEAEAIERILRSYNLQEVGKAKPTPVPVTAKLPKGAKIQELWEIQTPRNGIEIIDNIKDFAKEHKLDWVLLVCTKNIPGNYKGWKVLSVQRTVRQ